MAGSSSGSSGSSGYGSGSSPGKGSYSGGSTKGGYALAGAGSYAGSMSKGIYGKGGLAAYLSGYSIKGYSSALGKNNLSLGLSDSYLKATKNRFYFQADSKSRLRSLFKGNLDYCESFNKRDLEERLKKYEKMLRNCGGSETGYSMN